MHQLGNADPNKGQSEGAEVILIVGAGIGLDGMVLKHVVVKDSLVEYLGKQPMQLEDVTFVNCIFSISSNAPGRILQKPS